MSREPRVCVTASSTLDRTSLYSPTAPSFLGGIGSTPNLIPTDWIGKQKRRSHIRSKDQAIMSSAFSGDETAPFFGFLGAAAALVFSCMGAAYGTAKSGVGVASMGVMRPELVMKSIVPVVMAGVLGIYGLIIAVIISTGINPKTKSYYLFDGYAHLSSGLACGLAGLSAGMAIGIVGDAGVRANAQQPKLFVGMILILIFAEALALYGLIVGIILSSRAGQSRAE
nr:V-type proton ATPase 16 kDa proteolipid subunit [Ipomoea batatas]